jgi:3-deoxy-D-manno-octulosonic-acid transferase
MLGRADLFTELPSTSTPARFLIVNTIGLLSRIYRYGQFAYIGGGFGAGIHNTLEAAIYGIPVIFGPEYKKFREAVGLIDKAAAFSVRDEDELRKVLQQLTGDEGFRKESGASAKNYVMANAGATGLILEKLRKKV